MMTIPHCTTIMISEIFSSMSFLYFRSWSDWWCVESSPEETWFCLHLVQLCLCAVPLESVDSEKFWKFQLKKLHYVSVNTKEKLLIRSPTLGFGTSWPWSPSVSLEEFSAPFLAQELTFAPFQSSPSFSGKCQITWSRNLWSPYYWKIIKILLFRVSEKVTTPTSVVLMAINTCVGFYWRGCRTAKPLNIGRHLGEVLNRVNQF